MGLKRKLIYERFANACQGNNGFMLCFGNLIAERFVPFYRVISCICYKVNYKVCNKYVQLTFQKTKIVMSRAKRTFLVECTLILSDGPFSLSLGRSSKFPSLPFSLLFDCNKPDYEPWGSTLGPCSSTKKLTFHFLI